MGNPVIGENNLLNTNKTCEDVMSQDGTNVLDCTLQRAEPTSGDINISECSIPQNASRYKIFDRISGEIRTFPSLVTTDTIENSYVECKCDIDNGCWTSDNNNNEDAITPEIHPCETSGSPFILSGCEAQLCSIPSNLEGVQISDSFINEDDSGNRNFLPGTDSKTRVSYTCDDAHVLSTQMPDDGLDVGHAYAICDTDSHTLSFTRTDGTDACLSRCVSPDISNTNFEVTERSLSPENFDVSVNCKSGWSSQSSDERIVANNCNQNPTGDTYTIEGTCVADCTSDGLDIPSEDDLVGINISICGPDDPNNQENVDKCASIKNLYNLDTGPYQYHTAFTSFPDPGLESHCNSTDGCTYTEIEGDNPSIIIQGQNYGNDASKVFSHNSNFNIGSKSGQFLQCNESLGYYDNDAKSDEINFYATMCETPGDPYTLNEGQNDGTNDACFKKIHRVPEDRSLPNWVDPYKINVNHGHVNGFENPFTSDELANQDIFTCNDGFEIITEFNRPTITPRRHARTRAQRQEMPPLFALKGCKKICESDTPGIDAGCFYQETEEPFETAKDRNTYMEDFFRKINTENRIEVIEGSELLISANHVNHWREYIFNGKIYREIQVKIDSDEGIIIKGTNCETIDEIHNCRSIHLCQPDESDGCFTGEGLNTFSQHHGNERYDFETLRFPEIHGVGDDLQIKINFSSFESQFILKGAETFQFTRGPGGRHEDIKIYMIYLTSTNAEGLDGDNLINRESSEDNGIKIPYSGIGNGFSFGVIDGNSGGEHDGGSLTIRIPASYSISIDGNDIPILTNPGKFILKIEIKGNIYNGHSESDPTTPPRDPMYRGEHHQPRIGYKMFEVRTIQDAPTYDEFQRFFTLEFDENRNKVGDSVGFPLTQDQEKDLYETCRQLSDGRTASGLRSNCISQIQQGGPSSRDQCSAECYAIINQYLYNCDYPIDPNSLVDEENPLPEITPVPPDRYWRNNILDETQFTDKATAGKTSPFIELNYRYGDRHTNYASDTRRVFKDYIRNCEFTNNPCSSNNYIPDGSEAERRRGSLLQQDPSPLLTDNVLGLGEDEFCFANIGESCGKQNNKKFNLLKKINDNTKIMLLVLLIIFVIGYLFRTKK